MIFLLDKTLLSLLLLFVCLMTCVCVFVSSSSDTDYPLLSAERRPSKLDMSADKGGVVREGELAGTVV